MCYDPEELDVVAFEDLSDDWRCSRCKQPKDKFNPALRSSKTLSGINSTNDGYLKAENRLVCKRCHYEKPIKIKVLMG